MGIDEIGDVYIKSVVESLVESDYVQTPQWVARDMIDFFKPEGKILDPFRGLNKVFYNEIGKSCMWCEIQEEVDFFKFKTDVDWIIGNPPYSIFNPWMRHSFRLSKNIVYLLPTFKIFNALGLIRMYKEHGWIKHMRFYDTGNEIPWSRSRPIVAVHFQKNYFGDISSSFY